MRTMLPQHFFSALAIALVALAGCESGNAQPAEKAPAALEQSAEAASNSSAGDKPGSPPVIAQGSRTNLLEHADPDRYTVFDFTSEYCGPCRQIAPYLDKLHEGREDVTVVKVDINRPGVRGIDFRSPIAQQYGINSIPHFKVYDEAGTKVAEGDPAWQLVVKWIMELPEFQNQAQG